MAEDLEKQLGFPLPAEILNFTPEGNRLLVRTDPPDKSFGSIEIPDSVHQRPSSGIVVKAGPLAGTGNPEIGSAKLIYAGSALVGQHITFSEHVGMSCKLHTFDSTYGGEWLLMMARDVMGYNQPQAEPQAELNKE